MIFNATICFCCFYLYFYLLVQIICYLVCSVLPSFSFYLHCTALHQGCEREVAEAADGGPDERKNESIMRLSWALVHSRQPEDVKRGVAMLEGEI